MITETIRSDWAGRVVDGRFPLFQWLGGSESSGVFLTEVHDRGTRKAAIKLIPADARDEEARLVGWAAASELSHPHLMRLLHFGSCQIGATRLLYTVTDYAEEILSEILPSRPLTPGEAAEMLDPVLDALSYLHGKGFVHGRLKPSNILAVDDQLKLSCDSLYRVGEPARRLPPQGMYDAPECAAGTLSPAADIWSLGVTLVESLTQHPPLWDASKEQEPILPESIPQPLAGIVRESLRTDPRRRCSLRGVRVRLTVGRPLSALASRIRTVIPAKLRWPALIAAALILVAAIAVPRLQSHKAEPSQPVADEQPAPVPTPAPAPAPTPTPAALPPPVPLAVTQSPKAQDVNSAVAERVLPQASQKASETISGKIQVSVRITVDASGKVSEAALDSPGPSKYFAKLALETARQWRFKPRQADGRAVSSAWVLHFQFTRTAADVTPVEVTP
jgi:TonB family protein